MNEARKDSQDEVKRWPTKRITHETRLITEPLTKTLGSDVVRNIHHLSELPPDAPGKFRFVRSGL